MINERAYEKFKTQVNQIRTLEEARRHAAVGKMCNCGDCFCCAAQTGLAKFEKQADEVNAFFSQLDTISGANANKLIAIMDKAPYLALQIIAARKVKFAGKLAQNRIDKLAEYGRFTVVRHLPKK